MCGVNRSGGRAAGRNADQEVVLGVLFIHKSLAQECGRFEEILANSFQKTHTADLLCD